VIPFALVRVDDRLLHGQVSLGWRGALEPRSFVIVDDEVASDPLSAALFESAVPDGCRLVVLSAAAFLSGKGLEGIDPSRSILLLRGLPQLRSLCEGEFLPAEVNLGGIHFREGARRYNDYLFLTDTDLAAAKDLLRRGIPLYVQDLPSAPKRPLADVLAATGEGA